MSKELDRLTSLDCENLSLQGKLAHARGAAKIIKPKFYAKIVEAGKSVGYAIAVHGSRARDVDLVAIPWTDQAMDPFALVRAICRVTDGVAKNLPDELVATKPHGRMSVVILLFGTYIDLAIMPRVFK